MARLAHVLRAASPAAPVVVHHDPSGEPLHAGTRRSPAEMGVRVLEPPAPLGWGGPGLLVAVLRSRRIVLRALDFDRVVLLSGRRRAGCARPARASVVTQAASPPSDH